MASAEIERETDAYVEQFVRADSTRRAIRRAGGGNIHRTGKAQTGGRRARGAKTATVQVLDATWARLFGSRAVS